MIIAHERSDDMTVKRLYKSRSNAVLGGVCGGIGEYFDVDPTWIRLLVVLLTLVGFWVITIPGYILAWAIIPIATGEAGVGGTEPPETAGAPDR
jgi:phage shock protein PspC (stress-responsive transcriptional regulator)